MKTIEAFERDIIIQTQFLHVFKPQSLIPKSSQQNTIFCGSGDSLAAALLAEAFSDLRVRAADPLDLIKNKQITKLHSVFLISISGKTHESPSQLLQTQKANLQRHAKEPLN